jgi:hypothetical protein
LYGSWFTTTCAISAFYPEFEAAEDNEIEVILILDLSNSMKGKALLEAKKVLLLTCSWFTTTCAISAYHH